jgi:hypothetical protein
MNMHKAIVGVAACAILCGMNDAFGFFAEALEHGTPAIMAMPELGFGSGENDLRDLFSGTETNISMELFSDRENLNGWGVYGADLELSLAKDHGWGVSTAAAGGRVDGRFAALTWDETSWLDSVLDVGHKNSSLPTSWFLRTLTDDSLDKLYPGNIVSIPEPATYGLITIFGGGILLFRRRFKV